MAESDTRLETLEDEVIVLKGEVKRTLVDLRALLMKENSPLGESNFARRSATADQSSKSGGSEKVVIAVAAPFPAGPVLAPPPGPEPVLVTAAVPSPEGGLPGPALAQVGVAPPVTSAPQTGPEPAPGIFPTESSQLVATPVQRDPGPGSFPMVSPPGAMTLPAEGPGPAPDWAGLAEQERRMAEQERRILEQERRMSERERLLTEASRHQGPSSRQVNEDLWLEEEAEELTAAKASRRNGRSHKQILGMSYSPEAAGGKYSVGEVSQVLQDIPDDVTPLPERRSRRLRQNESEQGHRSPPRDEDSGLDLDRLEMKQLNEDDLESPEPNGRRVNVYDEYWDLLKASKEAYPIEDSPTGPPLDVNLLSSLVHWATLAKQRVGEQQLKDILELYIQSGHSRPELQELLLRVSDMVDEATLEGGERPEDWVDLMFHLHGILTGGLPVVKIPQMRFSAQSALERDGHS